MKKLIYQIEGYTDVYNIETGEVEQKPSIATVTVENPTEDDIARAANIDPNYRIEDDGQPEPVAEPTADDILNAMLGVNRYA